MAPKGARRKAPFRQKAPLCKGGWLAVGETGGLFHYTIILQIL